MKKYMPLEGLRWSRDSGSALCDTSQNSRSRTGWGGKFNKLILCFGRRTLYIYILHFYFIHGKLQLPAYVHDLLFSSPFYYLSIYSIFSFLIMIACVVLADLLDANKYIRKYIFGRRV